MTKPMSAARALIRTGVSLIPMIALLGMVPVASADVEGLGWRLIRKYCATCHEVQPHPTSQQRRADGPPDFNTVAADPARSSPAHLKSVLDGTLHHGMLPRRFSDAEVDAIAGAIQAQAGPSTTRSIR